MRSFVWAWKSLRREPSRTVLVILGVTAVGALLFDMLLLSRGLLLSFETALEETGFDVRVTATSALPGFGPDIEDASALAAELQRLPEVDVSIPLEFLPLAGTLPGTEPVALNALAAPSRRRNEWKLLQGRDYRDDARDPPELVVGEGMADAFGLVPGDTMELSAVSGAAGALAVTSSPVFLITGVVQFPFTAKGEWTVGANREVMREFALLPPGDTADLLLVASHPGIPASEAVAAIRAARPDVHPFTISEAIQRVRQTDFSYFRQISFVLSSITAFFAFLLVTTVLTVSINQRTGEIAALRALGISRRRVLADLVAEAVVLVGIGGLLAVPLGLALAEILDRILHTMPDVPERLWFFVFEPRAVVLHGIVLAGAAMLACLWPMVLVVRLPIADTLRKEVIG